MDLTFTEYMRERFRIKGVSQRILFQQTGISERYGYKLISGEKHTSNRDIIVKLCIGAGFCVAETDHALMLYGMSPLRPFSGRDGILSQAIMTGLNDVYEVSDMLSAAGYGGLE